MADDKYKGYRGPVLAALKNFGVYVWSDVEVQTKKGIFSGVILPRSETADDKHLVLKMSNGYFIFFHENRWISSFPVSSP